MNGDQEKANWVILQLEMSKILRLGAIQYF
jgi:hypothetical protein